MTQHIKDFCEDRARKGEAGFAIAYALLDLADAQEATVKALNRLGWNDAATKMGALEGLGLQIEKAAQIVGEHLEIAASGIRTD